MASLGTGIIGGRPLAADSSRVARFSGNPARSPRSKRSSKAPVLRDVAADWKRWSLPERTIAVATVAVFALTAAITPALTGHGTFGLIGH